MASTRLRQVVLWLWPLLWLTACAASQVPDAWWDEVDAADQLADEHQPAQAEAAYLALLDRAPTGSERRYLIYRLGLMAERQGRIQDAIDRYLSLLDHHDLYDALEDETPQGLFRVGLLLYDDLGRQQEALKVWECVIRYYPDAEGPVHRALDGILQYYDSHGLAQEAVRWLAAEYHDLADTHVGDNLLYWLAYWYRHHLNDPDRALDLFLQVRQRYFDSSSLRDQADWEIVEILHERGDYQREVHFLDTMRREREENIIFGPIVTEVMEEAAYRMGLVLLDDLHEPEAASQAFQEFLDVWRYSLWRDDAAFGLVRAAVALGDRDRIRAAAQAFVRDFSESPHLTEVEQILAGLDGGAP